MTIDIDCDMGESDGRSTLGHPGIQTICIHGDIPGAGHIVAAVRVALVKAGVAVTPLRDRLAR